MSADDAELDELVNDFVTESREHLAQVESDLLGLEASGEAPEEATNRVFRAVHSVKGVAGFLGAHRRAPAGGQGRGGEEGQQADAAEARGRGGCHGEAAGA